MVLPPPKADMEHSQTPQSGIQDTYRPLVARMGWSNRNQQSYPPQEKATTQRAVGGKFFDSTDGKCSTVSAQDYDEQIEREVAENIIDWWVSKKSYKQWYADKFLQHTFDFGQE